MSASEPWLGRYRELMPIRSRDAFHLLAAETEEGPAVLVSAAPRAEQSAANRALERLAEAHAKIESPWVPRTRRVVEDGSRLHVELACDAFLDGHDAVRLIADSGLRVPYVAADTFTTRLREGMQAAHAGGFFLGRICYGNVLHARAGRWYLIGFGHNVAATSEHGAPLGSSTSFAGPEVAIGGEPSAMGDYVALLMMVRSTVSYVDLLGGLVRVLKGMARAGDLELAKHIRWVDRHVYSMTPESAVTLDEAVRVSARIRSLLGVELDTSAVLSFYAELFARFEEPAPDEPAVEPPPPAREVVRIGPDAAWIVAPDGTKHQLGPRKALRRIVMALASRSERSTPMDVWALLRAGWPGEEPIYEAALNRVYVTMNRLRSLGLRDVVERFEGGYRIRPSVKVELEP